MDERRAFEILGVRIHAASFREVVDEIVRAPESGERLAFHFATAHTLVEAQRHPELREALSAGIVEPDGMPLVWLGRRAGIPVERVCGPDILPAVAGAGLRFDRSHFFYGGGPGTAEALARRLSERNPGMRVAGTISPPFRSLSPAEDAEMVDAINAARPDYVWVGLGAPKQDLWVASHRARLQAPVLLAVGAAFDFHSGRLRRAPRWMQVTGTEWLFRLASEPRRLVSRYTSVNARFVALVLSDAISRRRSR